MKTQLTRGLLLDCVLHAALTVFLMFLFDLATPYKLHDPSGLFIGFTIGNLIFRLWVKDALDKRLNRG